MKTAICWFRRDIRLRDNQALRTALSSADIVIPLFILDPHLLHIEAPCRKNFLFNNLRMLAHQLNELNCPLVIREGDPHSVLIRLSSEISATLITADADYSPYAIRRDKATAQRLPLKLAEGITLHPPGSVVKSDGTPYTIFTPYSRAWKALPSPRLPFPAPQVMPAHPLLYSEPLPDSSAIEGFPAGEANARQRLQEFLKNDLISYHSERDRMDLRGTSQLSPYLRFGVISINDVYAQLMDFIINQNLDYREGADKWLNELVWREFYFHIMFAFPSVIGAPFRENMRNIAWQDSPALFKAWCAGETGYPAVDAGMRQLSETGWMHNRARMITASFLTKDLLINWQSGESMFMRHLIDGDPASNNGGWQWTAGTGTDAAPYFRVFNPVSQSRKFDPLGDYIRTWLPELSNVPDGYIHEPWKMPLDEQALCGVHIGSDYPAPIVDHRLARERALAAYKKTA